MSTYESAYKSLLQGVSQQEPFERLPGQVTAQTNMLSDPVTNLRRRPGLVFKKSWAWAGAVSSRVGAWFTDVAGSRVNLLLNTVTGNLLVLDENWVQEASLTSPYLVNTDPSRIRMAAVGNEVYFCNVDIAPVLTYPSGGFAHSRSGFFYVGAGSFSRSYNVSVTGNAGSGTWQYTTPSGAGAGDAALSTPEYIAEHLAAQVNGGGVYAANRFGPYVFVQHGSQNLSVSTSMSSSFMVASNTGFVRTAGELPARLPAIANGYIVRVGTTTNPQYFKYVDSALEWVESGSPTSPTSITNCPISLYWTGSAWALDTNPFEGRLAGDNDSNPLHEFMTQGISGMSTYQGRLVLMSGPLVSLSASGSPRRFFRKTVSSVLSGDAIEVGSSMNSSAAYEWAVQFQKDLVLFSRAYQALIPSGNTAITPATATVVQTSSNETDTTSSPLILGRTVMYATPRSGDFFGFMEMIPSSYTDSQYVSQDSTPHLPKYMGGKCRFSVASSVSNMALVGPSGDPQSVVVYEYHWDGEEKVQQSWHTWTFEYPVATAYFAGESIVVVFVQNGQVVLCTIDPRAGVLDAAGERRPFLDLNLRVDFTSNTIPVPAWLRTFDPAVMAKLKAIVLTGPLAGELIGTEPAPSGTALTTVRSWESGVAGIGLPYYSGIVPSPPVVTDYNGEVIHGGKATVLRFVLGTRNSSQFNVRVSDANSAGDDVITPTLHWSSSELELGRALFSKQAGSIVPCRTDLRSTALEVYTEGTGELNLNWVEYIARFHPKTKRK
jgi:hypothetical protein